MADLQIIRKLLKMYREIHKELNSDDEFEYGQRSMLFSVIRDLENILDGK